MADCHHGSLGNGFERASRALREQGVFFAYVHGSVANGTESPDSDLDGELFLTVDEGAWIGRTASSWKR